MTSTELTRYQQDAQALLGEVEVRLADPDTIATAIMARILEADDVSAVFEQAGTTPAADLKDVPLELRDYVLMRSEYEQGAPVYALIDAMRLDTGDVIKVTCGSRNVLAQLVTMGRLGALPRRAAITEAGKPTAQGFRPMWLVPVGPNNGAVES